MRKRIISLALSLIMLFSLVPTTALAVYCNINATWTVSVNGSDYGGTWKDEVYNLGTFGPGQTTLAIRGEAFGYKEENVKIQSSLEVSGDYTLRYGSDDGEIVATGTNNVASETSYTIDKNSGSGATVSNEVTETVNTASFQDGTYYLTIDVSGTMGTYCEMTDTRYFTFTIQTVNTDKSTITVNSGEIYALEVSGNLVSRYAADTEAYLDYEIFNSNSETVESNQQKIGTLSADSLTVACDTFIDISSLNDGDSYTAKLRYAVKDANNRWGYGKTKQVSFTKKTPTVTLVAGEGGTIDAQTQPITYGTSIVTEGNTLQLGSVTVTATPNENCSFQRWSTSGITSVTEDVTIAAVFTKNHNHTEDAISTPEALTQLLENGGSGGLTADITMTGDSWITVPADKSVTLCLNGHTITITGDKGIMVLGSLTLEDCSGSGTGKICGNGSGTTAIAVGGGPNFAKEYNYYYVLSCPETTTSGTLQVNSGTIQNCKCGIFCSEQSVVNLTGGTISTNTYGVYGITAFYEDDKTGNLLMVDGAEISLGGDVRIIENSTANLRLPQYGYIGNDDVGKSLIDYSKKNPLHYSVKLLTGTEAPTETMRVGITATSLDWGYTCSNVFVEDERISQGVFQDIFFLDNGSANTYIKVSGSKFTRANRITTQPTESSPTVKMSTAEVGSDDAVPSYTYQWMKAEDEWTDIPDMTGTTLDITQIEEASYKVRITMTYTEDGGKTQRSIVMYSNVISPKFMATKVTDTSNNPGNSDLVYGVEDKTLHLQVYYRNYKSTDSVITPQSPTVVFKDKDGNDVTNGLKVTTKLSSPAKQYDYGVDGNEYIATFAVTAAKTLEAGTYYVYVNTDESTNIYGNDVLPRQTGFEITVGKADWLTLSSTGQAPIGKTNQYITLELPDGLTSEDISGITVKKGDVDSTDLTGIAVDTTDKKLTFNVNSGLTVDDVYTITFHVAESKCYNAFDYTVTATATDKLDISGLIDTSKMATDDTYDGEALTTGTATVPGHDVQFTYQWYKVTDNTTEPVTREAITSAPTNAGSYQLDIAVAEASQNDYTGGKTLDITISPKTVTVAKGTWAITKEYDGNSESSVGTVTGELAVSGILEQDSGVGVAVASRGKYQSAKGNDAVQVSKVAQMTLTLSLTGNDNGNYQLGNTSVVVPATVTKKTVTVTDIVVKDRAYNGEKTVALDSCTISGKADSYELTPVATYTMDDANVGNGKTVTITLTGLKGDRAANYTLDTANSQQTTTVNITRAVPVAGNFTYTAPTSTEYSGEEKAATVVINTKKAAYLTNQIGAITVKYSSDGGSTWSTDVPTDAGTYKVSISAPETDNVAAVTNLTADAWTFTITQKALTPSVSAVDSKAYDGTTATTGGTIALAGAIGDDKPTATGTVVWSDAAAGTKTVEVTDITLGSGWDNYTLSTTTLSAVTPGNNPGITNASLTDISVKQDGTLTYTGQPLTAAVKASATSVNAQEIAFSYSAEQNGAYTGTVPSFTAAGDHTVYYKATAQNHSDATGSFTVTIGKAAAAETASMTTPVTATATSITITATNGVEYYVSTSETAPSPWPSSGDSYYKATADGEHTFTGLSKDTKYYVHYRIAETDNYAASTTEKSVSAYTMAGGPAASCATVDYAAETISYDDTLYELFTGTDGTGSAVANGGSVTPGATLYLRTKATAEKPASEDTTIVLPGRPDTPAKPTETDRTDVAVSLQTADGCEYRIGSDSWTDSTTFSELTASTAYTFYQRVKATANSFASLPSDGLSLTTKAAAGTAPEASVTSVTQDSVTLATGTNWEYSNDGGTTWTSENSYTGLTAATAYTYQVRIKGTDTAMPSQAKTVTAYTAHKTPAAGEGYTMDGLNITVQEGYEVVEKAASGTQSWESPITSSSGAIALDAGKEYLIRKAQSGTAPAIYPASEAASFYSLPLPTSDLVEVTMPTDSTYTGEPIAVTAGAKSTTEGLGTITVQYSNDGGITWSETAPTDVGTYKVRLSIAVGTGYAAAVLPCDDLVITAVAPQVTAPQEKTKLVYNNTDLALAASGSTNDGTIYYALTSSATTAPSAGDWGTAIPTGKDAGTYHVWYYVKGDNNHSDTQPAEMDVTIGRASYDMSGIGFTDNTVVYTGNEQGLTVTGTLPTGLDGIQVTVSYSEGQKTVGSKKITASFATTSENYETPTAMKATITVTEATLSNVSVEQYGTLTYNGNPQYASLTQSATIVGLTGGAEVDFRYSTTENGTYTDSVPDFTDAGSHTVYYKASFANHKDATGSFTVTIDRKAVTVSGIAAENKTYDNTLTATLNYSGVQFGGMVSGDALSVTATGAFTDANAGESKTVNLSDLTLGGGSLANYVLADEGQQTTATANITPRAITAKWTNTEQVYTGEALAPTAQFINAVEGDSLAPVFDTDNTKSASGSYSLTAGLNNENYTLTNPFVNLVIQKAPVTFTVTNDTVKAGEGACQAVIGNDKSLVEGTDYTVVYKNAQGETVESPESVGDYEIYVVFTGDDYRLAGTSSSKENKVGVLTIYDSTAPETYIISFSGGDDATGTMNDITELKSGESVVLPDCQFTKSGYTFTGWKLGKSIYKAGTVFTQPADDVTFEAQWVEGNFSVSGIVYSSTGMVQPNAVVTLSTGANQIEQVVTDGNGAFSFNNVTPGLYNMSVSYDGITVTTAVQITNESVSETITLPTGRTNSVVEVCAGAPEIVVSGLEDSFANTTGNYTVADANIVGNGGTVEFKLEVAETSSLTETHEEQMQEKSGDGFIYLNLDLSKTIIDTNGVRSVTPLYEADNLLAITIKLPAEMQGKNSYHVYRFHSDDGSAENETLDEIKQLSGNSEPDEEGYSISSAGDSITVYAKNFSVYAISYTAESTNVGVVSKKNDACPQDETCVYAKFSDTDTKAWYHDGVHFCVENGYMDGVSATEFAPDATLSRAMIVTMLWRMENSPCVDYTMSFKDVSDGMWYTEAIRWAQSTGVVSGYDEYTFGPNDNITREQLAAILMRYAALKGIDISGRASLASFEDTDKISKWALASIKWANNIGIITGRTETTIAPQNTATRAEAACMVQRFCKTVIK